MTNKVNNYDSLMKKWETVNLIRCMCMSNLNEHYILSEFLDDFEEEVGYSVPTYGYKTALDFLKSIPETVEVVTIDGIIYLKLVPPKPILAHPRKRGKKKKNHEDSATSNLATSRQGNSLAKVYEMKKAKLKIKKKLTRAKVKAKKEAEELEKARLKAKAVKLDDDTEGSTSESEVEVSYIDQRELEQDGICPGCISFKLSNGLKEERSLLDRCVATVVKSESEIPLINLKNYAKIGSSVEAVVSEVESPHNFIIYLKEFYHQLTKLMARMLIFYNLNAEKYAVVNYKFYKDEMCAVLYKTNTESKEWYRGKIIDFGSEKSQVLLIDYGIKTEVPNSNLKFLDRSFARLPVQSVYGHLANVKPEAGTMWSEECCQVFYKHAYQRKLVADIIYFDSKNQRLYVELLCSDTNIYIGHAMVGESLAIHINDYYDEKSMSRYICKSAYTGRFIEPRDIEEGRRLRSAFLYYHYYNKNNKIKFNIKNEDIQEMFGFDAEDIDDPLSDYDFGSDTELESDSDLASKVNSEMDGQSDSDSDLDLQLNVEAHAHPDSDSDAMNSDSATENDTETNGKSDPQPASELDGEHAGKLDTELDKKSDSEPTRKLATESDTGLGS